MSRPPLASCIDASLIYRCPNNATLPRSELAVSQLTNEGLPALKPPPLPSPPTESMPAAPDGTSTPRPNISWELSPTTAPPGRKIRIVCISDTHNSSPLDGAFRIPHGDILVHAGDLTNQGSFPELNRVTKWLCAQPHELKIVIAGNHDGVTLDEEFHQEYASYFKFPRTQSTAENTALFFTPEAKAAGVVYMAHETRTFTLRDGREIKVFASPWTPVCGLWGFGYTAARAPQLWSDVPEKVDLLVTHGPPKYHLDYAPAAVPPDYRGCEELRKRIAKVKPRLHVFGHVHEGYGVEVVKWTEGGKVLAREENVRQVLDPNPERKKAWVVELRREGVGDGETVFVNAALRGKRARRKAVVIEMEVGSIVMPTGGWA